MNFAGACLTGSIRIWFVIRAGLEPVSLNTDSKDASRHAALRFLPSKFANQLLPSLASLRAYWRHMRQAPCSTHRSVALVVGQAANQLLDVLEQ
jgi:hypothetical protein